MNTEFRVALTGEPLSLTPATTQITSSLVNYKDIENICWILNNTPPNKMMNFGDNTPPRSYYETSNYTVMKNSTSLSISSSSWSSFDDNDEVEFGPSEESNYDTDEDNDFHCEKVIKELMFPANIDDAEFSLIDGMLNTREYLKVFEAGSNLYGGWNI